MEGVVIGRKGAGLRPFVQVFGPQVLDPNISDAAYRTLHLLDLLEGADREGCHSLALIAKLRAVDERTMRRHIRELEDSKMIEIEYCPGKTNRIFILEPLDIYGRGAIGGFYAKVQQTNKELRAAGGVSTSGSGRGDKNAPPQSPKNRRNYQ